MPIQSGEDLEWIKPHLPDDDAPLGYHQGNFMALNVRNAQPDMHYYWVARQPSQILKFLNMGYTVVQGDDPEEFGADLPEGIGLPQDGAAAYHDIILMKTPMDNYRQYKQDRIDRRQAAVQASEHAYMNKGREREAQYEPHQRPVGRDLYYARPNHETRQDDQPL